MNPGVALSFQLVIVLLAVAAAALFFGRGFVAGLLGQGCGTEGGCAKCSSGGGCTVTKLEAIKKEYEAKHQNGTVTR